MRCALKLGLIIWLICLVFAKSTYDKDYIIPEPIDTTHRPNGDTAKHYRQDMTPMLKRKKTKIIDVNVN